MKEKNQVVPDEVLSKEWTQPIHNWGLIMNQFMLIFENRIQI